MKLTMVKKQIKKIYTQQIDSVCLYGGSGFFFFFFGGGGGGGRGVSLWKYIGLGKVCQFGEMWIRFRGCSLALAQLLVGRWAF